MPNSTSTIYRLKRTILTFTNKISTAFLSLNGSLRNLDLHATVADIGSLKLMTIFIVSAVRAFEFEIA